MTCICDTIQRSSVSKLNKNGKRKSHMSKEFYLMVRGEVPATYCQRHDLQHVFPSKQMLPLPIHEKTSPSFIKLHLVRCLVRTMKRSHLEKVTFLVRLQCVSRHKMTFKLFQKLWSCWKIAFCHIGLLILVGYGIPRLTLLPLQLESYFQPFNDVNLIEESFPYTDPYNQSLKALRENTTTILMSHWRKISPSLIL